jgi:hypothetical protein
MGTMAIRKQEYIEGPKAFQNFQNLAKRIMNVPKEEIDRKEAEHAKTKQRKKESKARKDR